MQPDRPEDRYSIKRLAATSAAAHRAFRLEIVTGARCAWNAMTFAATKLVHARNAATARMLPMAVIVLAPVFTMT